MNKSFQSVYIILYALVLSVSICLLYVFRPFSYVDNLTSQINCNKDQRTFEIGPNFIYTFDTKLDDFNDIKARKTCEYNSIKDYGNLLKTPSKINYRFEPKYIQESSLSDAFLVALAFFLLGYIIIETIFSHLSNKLTLKKNVIYHILLFSLSISILFFLLKKPTVQIFCQRQIARKINNFKRIIFKYEVFPIPEEDAHIKSAIPNLYKDCLNREGI